MESLKDVHTEHCCILHGCKYSKPDCTVVLKKARQSFICEDCDYSGIKSVGELYAVLAGEIKTCPHCRHVI